MDVSPASVLWAKGVTPPGFRPKCVLNEHHHQTVCSTKSGQSRAPIDAGLCQARWRTTLLHLLAAWQHDCHPSNPLCFPCSKSLWKWLELKAFSTLEFFSDAPQSLMASLVLMQCVSFRFSLHNFDTSLSSSSSNPKVYPNSRATTSEITIPMPSVLFLWGTWPSMLQC